MSVSKETYALYSQVYFDPYTKEYKNIITINCTPKGELSTLIRTARFEPISPFKQRQVGCSITFRSFQFYNELMTLEELPTLFTFLASYGYEIDATLTKMINSNKNMIDNDQKLIAFIIYKN
jgi:hypothetical protein